MFINWSQLLDDLWIHSTLENWDNTIILSLLNSCIFRQLNWFNLSVLLSWVVKLFSWLLIEMQYQHMICLLAQHNNSCERHSESKVCFAFERKLTIFVLNFMLSFILYSNKLIGKWLSNDNNMSCLSTLSMSFQIVSSEKHLHCPRFNLFIFRYFLFIARNKIKRFSNFWR